MSTELPKSAVAEILVNKIATLDAADPAPAFVPDVPGTYMLQLVVINEDGISSLPARIALLAVDGNAAPAPHSAAVVETIAPELDGGDQHAERENSPAGERQPVRPSGRSGHLRTIERITA